MDTVDILCIGDLHVGAVDIAQFSKECDLIIDSIHQHKPKLVVQLGDFFHKMLSLNSVDSVFALNLVARICEATRAVGSVFRIVKGTLSHDYLQLENYRGLSNVYPHFRVITTIEAEETLPDFFVLWMPEEYPKSYGEYYTKYFVENGDDLVYDAIFGHGEIAIASSWAESESSERSYAGSHTHDHDYLLSHCAGPVWFGHIHTRLVYKNRLGYPGSFTRWVFGEEAAKGIDLLKLTIGHPLNMNDQGHGIEIVRIENKLARTFDTVDASELFVNSETMEAKFEAISKKLETSDMLRINLDSNLDVEEIFLLKNFIKTLNNRVKLKNQNVKNLNVVSDVDVEVVSDFSSSFLKDPTLKPEEKIRMYISENNPDINITLDQILELINEAG